MMKAILMILICFMFYACNRNTKNDLQKIEVYSLGYVNDTNYLKSIIDSALPSGNFVSSIGYYRYTKKYIKFRIKNYLSQPIYLQNLTYPKFPIDTLLTLSITITKYGNDQNSFDTIIRPRIIKDFFATDNIIILPGSTVEKIVETDTDLDLTGKRVVINLSYKTKQSDSSLLRHTENLIVSPI